VPSWQGGPKVMKAVTAQPGLNHLSFDMSTGTGWNATTEWATFVIFPNFGADDTGYSGATAAPVSGQVYEIDNVSINGGTAPVVPPSVTSTVYSFETDDAAGALLAGAATNDKLQGGFEGAVTTIADAPAGGNGGKALKIQKAVGGQVYAGVNMVKFAVTDRITDETHKLVTFNYYSPKANSPVRLELTPWPVALGVVVNAAQGWQTLTFDLSTATGNDGAVWSAATEYQSMALFPDFNNAADDAVYYVDNFAFNGGTTPAIVVARSATSTLLTFESADALGATVVGESTPTKAGSYGGATSSIAAAPAGGNGGQALKIEKQTGDEVWAGVNMFIFTADTRITNAEKKLITFNYYASKAGPVRVEIVPYPVGLGITLQAVQGWQTLSFDMSTATGGSGAVWSADTEYTAMALFPDFNLAADNSTFYVDNVAINGATTPAIPVAPVTVAPTMRTAASISGLAKLGKTLTVAKGSWTGTPTPTYTYRWYRCTVSGSTAKTTLPTTALKCVVITGATSSTHKVVTLDKGKYLRALVTVKNSKGTKYSLTKTTAKVS